MKRPVCLAAPACAALIFVAALCPGRVAADMFGASDSVIIMKLSAIYNSCQQYYNKAVEVLKEAKVHSDRLNDIKKTSQQMYAKYKFVKNFDGQRELVKIKDDLKGLTYLDNLEGKSTETQIRLIMKEIDRRFGNSRDKDERELHRRMKDRLATLERLHKLQQAKAEEATQAAQGRENLNDLQITTASSTALMASLQLAAEQRRIRREIQAEAAQKEGEKLMDDFGVTLEKMSQQ